MAWKYTGKFLTSQCFFPILCSIFLSPLPVKFRTYLPQKPCNAEIVLLALYPQDSISSSVGSTLMCESEDQWFEAWLRPWQFFPSILLYNSTIASWIIAVIMTYIYLHVGWHFSLLLVAFFPWFSQPVFEHSSIKCCRNSLFYNNQLFFFPSFSFCIVSAIKWCFNSTKLAKISLSPTTFTWFLSQFKPVSVCQLPRPQLSEAPA